MMIIPNADQHLYQRKFLHTSLARKGPVKLAGTRVSEPISDFGGAHLGIATVPQAGMSRIYPHRKNLQAADRRQLGSAGDSPKEIICVQVPAGIAALDGAPCQGANSLHTLEQETSNVSLAYSLPN